MATSESWPFPSAHVVARFWQQPFKKWSKISQLCPSLISIYEKCPIEVLAAKWDCKITFKSLFTFSSLHCEWLLRGRHEKVKSVCVLLVWSGCVFFYIYICIWDLMMKIRPYFAGEHSKKILVFRQQFTNFPPWTIDMNHLPWDSHFVLQKIMQH